MPSGLHAHDVTAPGRLSCRSCVHVSSAITQSDRYSVWTDALSRDAMSTSSPPQVASAPPVPSLAREQKQRHVRRALDTSGCSESSGLTSVSSDIHRPT